MIPTHLRIGFGPNRAREMESISKIMEKPLKVYMDVDLS